MNDQNDQKSDEIMADETAAVDANEEPSQPGTSAPFRERHNKDILSGISEEERSPKLFLSLLISGIATGIATNILLGGAPGVGLNLFLLAVVFFMGWFVISRQRQIPAWRKACAGAAMCYALALSFRASEILFTVNMLLLIGFTGLACSAAYGQRMKSAFGTFLDLAQVGFNLLLGFIMLMAETPWKRIKRRRHESGVIGRVFLGAIIAVPFLIIFGILFSRADLKFQEIFTGWFTALMDALFNHFWLTFYGVFFALGLLRSSFVSESVSADEPSPGTRNGIGFVESATALSLLNAMFLIFVLIQIPYLFGGQSQVSKTPDLAWSDYARRGFFELAWVAALLIPTLMLFMNFTRINTMKQRNALLGLCFGLTAFTGIVILSALQRMLLYTANYGLTELRIYVSVFIVLLAVILVMLNAFNVMDRMRWFLPASLALGFVVSIGIQAPNVQGIVARDIITRHLAGKQGDMDYLVDLSSDAVPVILKSKLSKAEIEETSANILGWAGLIRDYDYVSLSRLYYPLSAIDAVNAAKEFGLKPNREGPVEYD